ncbi:CaiB/BaiF CoA transferase family protein [Frankia sp. AgB1.8]|uniref:CaiB/BaiF CoA transferase family protein n=1 Tax=unclassified Frankia TaxID=2632575 RepID=UPI0035A95D39
METPSGSVIDGAGGRPRGGPLAGVRVVELAGRGPGPFGVMVLADLGAEVVRVARVEDVATGDDESATERALRGHRRHDLVTRGRPSVALDLKHPDGVAAALRLIDGADVVVEGFRPGVAERLGLGPDLCLDRNPRLVYARMTGFGQDGPYARSPGHDINYVALAGALEPLRRSGQPPAPPLNLLGDYGGGGMLLVVGVLAALVERAVSGRGQVVDAAMVDGVALLTTLLHGMRAEGSWSDDPGQNILGLAAPFYNVYETADGRHVAVGAGEHQFYSRLLGLIGLDDEAEAELVRGQSDPATWPAARDQLAGVFRTRTLDEWSKLLESTDTCFTPILTPAEAAHHPHNLARGTFVDVDGVVQPAPAPRFSRTPSGPVSPPAAAGEHTRKALLAWGFSDAEIAGLLTSGAARQAP